MERKQLEKRRRKRRRVSRRARNSRKRMGWRRSMIITREGVTLFLNAYE